MSEDSTQSSEVEQSQESGIESLEHSFHPQKNEIVELIPETRRSTTSRRFGSTSSTESYEDLLDELQELLDPNRPDKPSSWPDVRGSSDIFEDLHEEDLWIENGDSIDLIGQILNIKRSPFIMDDFINSCQIEPSERLHAIPTYVIPSNNWKCGVDKIPSPTCSDDEVFFSDPITDLSASNYHISTPKKSSNNTKNWPTFSAGLSRIIREMGYSIIPEILNSEEFLLKRGETPAAQHTKHKDWITDEILHVINFRDNLYKVSKKNPSPCIVELYKKVRNMVVGMTRNAKRSYDKTKSMIQVNASRSLRAPGPAYHSSNSWYNTDRII